MARRGATMHAVLTPLARTGAPRAAARTQHLDSLQALRGLAALMVVLYHSGTLYATHLDQLLWGNAFRAGFAGVDVFFVLSGLVIWWVHGEDLGRPQRLRRFAIRRGFRLLPVYWAVAGAKLLKEALTDPAALGGATLLAALLLVPYPAPFLNVAWTLSYELVFYALFGLWIVLPRRWGWLPPALLLGAAAWPVLAGAFGWPRPAGEGFGPAMARFLTSAHLLEFGFGVAVGWWLKRGPVPSRRLALALVALGAVAFVGFALAGTGLAQAAWATGTLGAYEAAELRGNAIFDRAVWCFGLPAALLLAGVVALERRGALWLPGRTLWVGIGDMSYSLYLTHGFVLHLALSAPPLRALAAGQPLLVLLPAWGLAGLVAWGCWRAIEQPAMRWGARLSKERAA